jgi:hypothetical protein
MSLGDADEPLLHLRRIGIGHVPHSGMLGATSLNWTRSPWPTIINGL